MAIRLSWDNKEKTILRHTYKGEWTVRDYQRSMSEARQLMSSVSHKVNVILDFTRTNARPINLLSKNHSKDNSPTPNQGMLVAVGLTPYMKALLNQTRIVMPIADANVQVVNRLHEAYRLLDEGAGLQ